MKKLRFASAAICLSSLLISLCSCKKVYDYIHDHPDAPEDYCKLTSFTFYDGLAQRLTMSIRYNAAGNPTDMTQSMLPIPVPSNVDRHFRYDRTQRLTDYIQNLINSPNAQSWHKYGYPRKDYVTDTLIYYNGPIDGPAPSAASYIYGLYAYQMDAKGRIAKVYSLTREGQPSGYFDMNYDTQGNLIHDTSAIVYDDKINIYRTSKIWQFIYNDYSRNNPYFFNQAIITYNEIGLPTSLPDLSRYNYRLFECNLTNEIFNQFVNIQYACSTPKGPIDY